MAFPVSPDVNVTEVDLTTIAPSVATTTGAIAGVFNWGPIGERVSIATESDLVTFFGKPNANNYETFFTAANFLSYNNSLLVVRAANTTSMNANGTYSAFANVGTVTNTANQTVKNSVDYETNKLTFDANVVYVAKYAGALGNSLRVSVCSSVNAYQSNVTLVQSVVGNTVIGTFGLAVGSNTATVQFTGNSALAANTFAANFASSFSAGDLVTVGNSTVGTQLLTLASVSGPNSSTTNVVMNFTGIYTLSSDFSANTELTRSWEFSTLVDSAPATSQFVANFGNSAAVDTMHVVVVDQDGMFTGISGQVLEVFTDMSRATDAKSVDGASIYYKKVINESSNYIWWANDRSNAVSNTALNITSSTNYSALNLNFSGGQDGFTESNAPVSILASGYDLFNAKETSDISLVLQGKPTGGTTTSQGLTVNNFQLANYLIDNIASTRKDCVVLITPDDTLARANAGQEAKYTVAWANIIRDTSYAMIDSGYKYMYDRYNDVYRYVPLNGDIAGLMARTESTNDAWWSPAGFNRGQIKNIVKLRWNPIKTDRDTLYKNAVNPVVTFPGQGTVLFGDKTATRKPSAFDRINVRRLFIVLEKSISEAAKYSLFEFNDEFTRSQFRNLVNPYLREVQGRRGITDFLVVCDGTNNTPERIDRNEFWGDIYIKPARSINYVQLNFVAVRTGVQFSTVVGQF